MPEPAAPRSGPSATPAAPGDATPWALAFAAWLVAAVATLGALFLGEVMHLPTCTLCWYQRICLFPLVVVLPFGLFPFDLAVVRCARWLATIGLAIAAYHLALTGGVIPESLQPCEQGVPCSKRVLEGLGFVDVPLLAAAAFAAIVVLTALAARSGGSR